MKNIGQHTLELIIKKKLYDILTPDQQIQLSHLYSQLNHYVGASVLGKYKWLFVPPTDNEVDGAIEAISDLMPDEIHITDKNGNTHTIKPKVNKEVIYDTLTKGKDSSLNFVHSLMSGALSTGKFDWKQTITQAAAQIPQLSGIMSIFNQVKSEARIMKKPLHQPVDESDFNYKQRIKQSIEHGGDDWLPYTLIDPNSVKQSKGMIDYLKKKLPALSKDYMKLQKTIDPKNIGFYNRLHFTPDRYNKYLREYFKLDIKDPYKVDLDSRIKFLEYLEKGNHVGINTKNNDTNIQKIITNQVGLKKTTLQRLPQQATETNAVDDNREDITHDGLGGTPYYKDKPLILKIMEITDSGYKELFRTNKMWLQSDSVALQEKYQYIGSSIDGADALIFYGRKKPIHSIVLAVPNRLDTEDNWWLRFRKHYDVDYRGSNQASTDTIIEFEYEDVILRGYILRIGYNRSAMNPRVVMVSVSFFEHEIIYKGKDVYHPIYNTTPRTTAQYTTPIGPKLDLNNENVVNNYKPLWGTKEKITEIPKHRVPGDYLIGTFEILPEEELSKIDSDKGKLMPAVFPMITVNNSDEIVNRMKNIYQGSNITTEDEVVRNELLKKGETYTVIRDNNYNIVGVLHAKADKLRPTAQPEKYIGNFTYKNNYDDFHRKLNDYIVKNVQNIGINIDDIEQNHSIELPDNSFSKLSFTSNMMESEAMSIESDKPIIISTAPAHMPESVIREVKDEEKLNEKI